MDIDDNNEYFYLKKFVMFLLLNTAYSLAQENFQVYCT